MDPEALLAQLDPEQRAAVTATRGPVCILAGAGTGKTRAITYRIAYAALTGTVDPRHVLAVTFTARAAGELRGRLRALGAEAVQARTFHAAALRQLSHFWPRVVGGEMGQIVDSKYPLVGTASGRARLRVSPAEVRDLVAEIEWAKARLVGPEAYVGAAERAGRQPPRDAVEVAAVYAEYEKAKARAGALDFDDLLLLTAAAIEEHDDVAGEIRSRYRYFVVDEYQDVNPLQQRLLDAWLGERRELCVVGDDDQTIYSFTGASRDYLLHFGERFPDAEVIRLVRDYRSTPQVVELANKVIAADRTRREPKRLVAQLGAGPPPAFAEHDSEPEEAAWAAQRIRALLDTGIKPGEIAVLYRINAQSEVYEAALSAAGIPYLVRGGQRFFERREVREAIGALRIAAARMDPPEVIPDHSGPQAIPDHPGPEGIPDQLEGSGGLVAAVHAALERLDWRPDAPPAGAGAARDRWEAIAALAGLAGELAALEPDAALPAFVAELEQRAADQHAPAVQGVTLASLHAAKGLEWDAMFLVGLADGTLPYQAATTDDAIAEERRLLYVGITRTRVHLHLSWALARARGGRRTRRRTRFLDGIAGPPAARADGPRRAPATCRVCGAPLFSATARKLRRCDGCPASMDEALFERLRDWRKTRAAALGQPAYCVFTDATLQAIAESGPADVGALAAIPGVGPTKLDKFGAEVLALVADR